MVELRAWGVSVSTQALDRGVVLGHSRRLYVYPKAAAEGTGGGVTLEVLAPREEDRLRLVTDLGSEGGGEHAMQKGDGATRPLACWTSRTGLALRLSGGEGVAPGFALGLGFEQRGVIDIDPAQDGVLLLLLSPGASDPDALGWALAQFRGSGTPKGDTACSSSTSGPKSADSDHPAAPDTAGELGTTRP